MQELKYFSTGKVKEHNIGDTCTNRYVSHQSYSPENPELVAVILAKKIQEGERRQVPQNVQRQTQNLRAPEVHHCQRKITLLPHFSFHKQKVNHSKTPAERESGNTGLQHLPYTSINNNNKKTLLSFSPLTATFAYPKLPCVWYKW